MNNLSPEELRLKIASIKGWRLLAIVSTPENDNYKTPRTIDRLFKPEESDTDFAPFWKFQEEFPLSKLTEGDVNRNIPDWPGSIADAWELVEEMAETGYVAVFNDDGWNCTLFIDGPGLFADNTAQTAPLAICAAWLAWKEGTK